MASFSQQDGQLLLEFRAGKMVMHGTQVSADHRKGLCRIVRGEEGLLHLQWIDRTSGRVEDDHIVFPDEAVFEKVQQSASRVYILKFKQDDRKLFFWLQEPAADRDSVICGTVNYLINNQPSLEEDDEETVPQAALDNTDEPERQETVGTADYTSRPVQLVDLQRILSSLTGSSGGDMSALARDPGPSLSEVLKVDNVLPLLENSGLEERLSPYLPEGEWNVEAIVELLKSPQFRQQLDMFSLALRSGQMDLSQFGIDPSKCDFTVASFLEAIEDQVEETKRDDMDE